MAALEVWRKIEMKRLELIDTFVTQRRAKIAAGEPDPHIGQPADGHSLFIASLGSPNDASVVAGRLVCCNFFLAARKIVGENLWATHAVATTEQIAKFWEESEANHQSEMRMENATNMRRVVHVLPAEPRKKSA